MSIEITDHTEEVTNGISAATIRALERMGSQCEGYAVDLCPVDTGRLQGSITYRVIISPEKSVVVGTNVEYGIDVELGTYKMHAQPFLRPAAQDHVGTYRNILKDELQNA